VLLRLAAASGFQTMLTPCLAHRAAPFYKQSQHVQAWRFAWVNQEPSTFHPLLHHELSASWMSTAQALKARRITVITSHDIA